MFQTLSGTQRSHQSEERHKNLKPYELLLIITPDHDENEADALTNQVKGIIEGGGTLLKLDPWGKRSLAYPIRKRSEGYYVLYIFESDPSFIAGLNQSLHVIEPILRYMVVQYENDIEKLKAELAAASTESDAAAETETPEADAPTTDAAADDDKATTENTTEDTADAETEDTAASA